MFKHQLERDINNQSVYKGHYNSTSNTQHHLASAIVGLRSRIETYKKALKNKLQRGIIKDNVGEKEVNRLRKLYLTRYSDSKEIKDIIDNFEQCCKQHFK